jgi:non-homologous end joining protein Ku
LKELIKRDNIDELREEYLRLNFKDSFNRAIAMILNSKAAGSKKKLSKKKASKYEKI